MIGSEQILSNMSTCTEKDLAENTFFFIFCILDDHLLYLMAINSCILR